MLRTFRSLLSRKPAPAAQRAVEEDIPRPLQPTYVVGDIHGRADLLEVMLELIDAHVGGSGSTDPKLIFVGDYIDHGPESKAVLDRLRELSQGLPAQMSFA